MGLEVDHRNLWNFEHWHSPLTARKKLKMKERRRQWWWARGIFIDIFANFTLTNTEYIGIIWRSAVWDLVMESLCWIIIGGSSLYCMALQLVRGAVAFYFQHHLSTEKKEKACSNKVPVGSFTDDKFIHPSISVLSGFAGFTTFSSPVDTYESRGMKRCVPTCI